MSKNMNMIVSDLFIYPVKSARGNRLGSAVIDTRGFRFDRRWMVVDSDGTFITQRQQPEMVLIEVECDSRRLQLKAPNGNPLTVLMNDLYRPLQVMIWKDTCQAIDAGDDAADWLSNYLKRECRLAFFPDESVRPLSPKFANAGDQTGFADGFPFLLISEASLADLNSRLPQSVSMNRFRPNIVVKGTTAYAEDGWKRIRIGRSEFRVAKPCSRCVMTTIDPKVGAKDGKEPLMTLAKYRKTEFGVVFGQNLIHDSVGGIVRVGDTVEMLE